MKPDAIPVDEALGMYRDATYLGRQRNELARRRNDIAREAEATVGAINALRGHMARLGPHGQDTGAVILEVCDTDDGLRYYKVGEMQVGPWNASNPTDMTVRVRFGVAFDVQPAELSTESAHAGHPGRENDITQEQVNSVYGRPLYCYWTAAPESLADAAVEPNASQPAIHNANLSLDSLQESITVIHAAAHNPTLNVPTDDSRGDS